MPTCAAHGCVNTTGRLKEKKSFFRIPRPVTESEKKRAAKWLHNMGMGQNVKTYVFGQDKVLCQDHFHPSCLKEDMRAKILGYKPKKEKQELLPGSLPTIFQIQNLRPDKYGWHKSYVTWNFAETNTRNGT